MIQETATHMADYLPGNGGLLYAVAMIAAGWDGARLQVFPTMELGW